MAKANKVTHLYQLLDPFEYSVAKLSLVCSPLIFNMIQLKFVITHVCANVHPNTQIRHNENSCFRLKTMKVW